jgi:hypothetical protein
MSTTYGARWTNGRIYPARLLLFQEIFERVSGTVQTPEVMSHLVRPKRQGTNGYRHIARRDRLRRLEPGYQSARHPIWRMKVRCQEMVGAGIAHDQMHYCPEADSSMSQKAASPIVTKPFATV